MRKCIYFMMVSLDGFIEDSHKSIEWVHIDEEIHRFANLREREVGLHLYGRRMYELMADFWPTADADPANPDYIVEYARIWKDMPKMVFSQSLTQVNRENTILIKEDPIKVITHLKEQPGKDISVGGATFAKTCIDAGLVDEYQLCINPIILGSGTPMLPLLSAPLSLELLETHVFQSGVIFLRYGVKP